MYFPKVHGLFLMMEIVFLFLSYLLARNLAMEYHFIQRERSNITDRFMLVETFQPRMGHLARMQNLSSYFKKYRPSVYTGRRFINNVAPSREKILENVM